MCLKDFLPRLLVEHQLLHHQRKVHQAVRNQNLNINVKIREGLGQEKGHGQGLEKGGQGQSHLQGQKRRKEKGLLPHQVLMLLLEGNICGIFVVSFIYGILSYWEVNCWFYGRKFHFTVMHQGAIKCSVGP